MSRMTNPTRIQELNEASQAWFAMVAGMQLDLFTPLAGGSLTAGELAAALDVRAGKLSPLLYALVVAGFLTVEDEDGRFGNTEESQQFLVRGTPTYMGDLHTFLVELAEAGMNIAESARTDTALANHDYTTMTEDELLALLGGLHPHSLNAGRVLAQRYDFDSYRNVLDIGGGSGGLSIALVQACPNLRATIVELPSVLPIARRFIRESGLDDRIDAIAVDVVRERVPGRYDAAVLKSFTQVLSADDAQAAVRTVWHALRPGGAIYLPNQVLDDSRLTPASTVLVNALSISFYDDGQVYTDGEHRAWLSEAGFVDVSREEPIGNQGLFVARKPA